MRVRVAQIGARKGYAAVQAFAQAGALESLCTDFYFRGVCASATAELIRLLGGKRAAMMMRSRCCSQIGRVPVHSFPVRSLIDRWQLRMAIRRGEIYRAYLKGGARFATAVARLPWKNVDVFYGFSSACLEAFQVARQHGVVCVLDCETAPAAVEHNLVRQAENCYAEWLPRPAPSTVPGLAEYARRQHDEASLADLILCPSSFASNLVTNSGINPDRVLTLPFAMQDHFSCQKESHTGPLRVLFAGNDAIRKGLPVLVEALRQLPEGEVEARGAGSWQISSFGWQQCHQTLTAMGPVPRPEMLALYRWADVFVLPTFSDTMGVVILEAMACGVPVITTSESGGPDIIRSGFDGFILPQNTAADVTKCLLELSRNRELLAVLARNAAATSKRFGIVQYAERLVAAIDKHRIPTTVSDRALAN